MRVSLTDVEVCFNGAMTSTYGRLDVMVAGSSLPVDLRTLATGGVVLLGDRVYLRRHWTSRGAAAEQMDRWSAERWVNDTHLRIPPASSNASWRAQLLGWGIVTALSLLGDAEERGCSLDLQAIVSLQSAPGAAASENPFELGALNLHSVQRSDDDLASRIEHFTEPVVTLTRRLRKPTR